MPETRADPGDAGPLAMLTPRRITALVLTVLVLVFVFQNRDEAVLQLLGIRITAPLWLASLALLVIGIAIGSLVSRRPPRGSARG